jgi:hypothetical protein
MPVSLSLRFGAPFSNGTGVHRSLALWVAKRLVCISHLS